MLKRLMKRLVVFIITWEARLVLRKYKPRIIAITGSVGKTSTKDAIYKLLAEREFIRKSEKSYNSEIGVPLTILGVPNAWNNVLKWGKNIFAGLLLLTGKEKYPKLLILEIGADRPGDIESISSWLHPDIAVVTRFAPVPVHVEFFGSREDLIKEKSYLVKALKKDGMLVLSRDDGDVHDLIHLVTNEAITYGFSKKSDIFASKETISYEGRGENRRPTGNSVKISYGDESAAISIKNSIGRQQIYAVICAAAVGVAMQMSLTDIAKSLTDFEGPAGRMRLIRGKNKSTIIDDSYNSSPIAVREALDALNSLETKGRKIAVLGDMLELGKFSVSEHKEIGKYVFGKAAILVTVGVRSRDCAIGALESGMSAENILEFDDSSSAADFLSGFVKQGDAVLVKGSQGIRCERIVEKLMDNPREKNSVLARQEEEWKKR